MPPENQRLIAKLFAPSLFLLILDKNAKNKFGGILHKKIKLSSHWKCGKKDKLGASALFTAKIGTKQTNLFVILTVFR